MTKERQLTKGRRVATATKDASRILLLLLRLPKPAGILCAETCFMSAGEQHGECCFTTGVLSKSRCGITEESSSRVRLLSLILLSPS